MGSHPDPPRHVARPRLAGHQSVKHGKDEHVRPGAPTIHTNTVEGYYSIFKRGMKGVYQHCSKKHLHRYMAEFDFRYSNRSALGCEDVERAERALKGVVGKPLTYKGLTAGPRPPPNGRWRGARWKARPRRR